MGLPTLVLSAGHGGADRGNTAAGIVEADETLAIVSDFRRWFADKQIPRVAGGCVFLQDDLDLIGQLRALQPWKLKEADNDLAVDIHLDYKRDRPEGGAMMITSRHPLAVRFAERYLAAWCEATGIKSNGCHFGDVVGPRWRGFVFGWTDRPWPAVIVELGSLNCERDMAIVRDPYYRALAAELMVEIWRSSYAAP